MNEEVNLAVPQFDSYAAEVKWLVEYAKQQSAEWLAEYDRLMNDCEYAQTQVEYWEKEAQRYAPEA